MIKLLADIVIKSSQFSFTCFTEAERRYAMINDVWNLHIIQTPNDSIFGCA